MDRSDFGADTLRPEFSWRAADGMHSSQLRSWALPQGALVDRSDDGLYRIRTADGAELTLDRDQIARVVPQDDALAEYQQRSRQSADTADAHRVLAAWCREKGLIDEADHHLQRVADLDPDDDAARQSLGQVRVGNRWLSREDAMRALGLAMFDGKWRTAQDIAIRQRDGAVGEGESNWFGKIRLWRGWLDSRREDRAEEAQVEFANITDPQAAPALVKLLDGEEEPWAFDILLGALGRLDDALTVRTLVGYSLEFEHADDRWADKVREDCLDYLLSSGRPVSVIPYVEALTSKDNVIVNRAGEALERIGDAAAISPLIDALVTTHKYQVQAAGPSHSATFDPSGAGGGGFSFGGGGPKFENRDEENPTVLRALKKLSGGQNFDYDKVAWRRWYVDLLMRQHTNARRDE
jgi:hypothetical protein